MRLAETRLTNPAETTIETIADFEPIGNVPDVLEEWYSIPPKPHAPTVNAEGIPADLKTLCQWVVWRYAWNSKKWTKEPYRISGYLASATDIRTWNTFQACHATYQRGGFDGIGIVCANRLFGFDIDHCIAPDGRWTEAACDIVCGMDSYSEFTPGGTGIRVLAYGDLPIGWRKNTTLNIECYSSARYFTVTGQHMIGTPGSPQERTAEAAELHARYAPETEPHPKATPPAQPAQIGAALREDDDIIRIAAHAKNATKVIALLRGDISGYPSASEADAALCAALAFYTKDAAQIDRIFKRSGLYRGKWDVKHYEGGATYGQVTIEKALVFVGGAA